MGLWLELGLELGLGLWGLGLVVLMFLSRISDL